MFKKFSFTVLLSAILLLVTFTMDTSKAKAGYADNPSKLYYDLADKVYSVGKKTNAEIQHEINLEHGPNKFKVIDSVHLDSDDPLKNRHPMASPGNSLNKTGFKAMAVIINPNNPDNPNPSKKLFIAFAGTQDKDDIANAAVTLLNGKTPGQLHQAHLYLNYIYDNFGYKDYQWYFTGHSLGGWLAAKSFLDVRAGITVVGDPKFTHWGPIKKKPSGVYTFNALPVAKTQMTDTQWTANKNLTYHSDVKNLYVDNEWLNSIQDMHPSQLAYIGEEGSVTQYKLPNWKTKFYMPTTPIIDIGLYFAKNLNNDITDKHSLKYLSSSVYH